MQITIIPSFFFHFQFKIKPITYPFHLISSLSLSNPFHLHLHIIHSSFNLQPSFFINHQSITIKDHSSEKQKGKKKVSSSNPLEVPKGKCTKVRSQKESLKPCNKIVALCNPSNVSRFASDSSSQTQNIFRLVHKVSHLLFE